MANPLSATLTLREGLTFNATATSGHTVVLDSGPDESGTTQGFSPMELLLMGLGGCTGMDVISILRKMRQDVVEYEVKVDGDRSGLHPKVYTDITVEHTLRGRRISEDSVRKAIELSATRYCPASAMLSKVSRITNRYRIVDSESGQEVRGSL